MALNQFRVTDGKGVVVTPKNTRECKAAEALKAGDIVKIKNIDSPITVVEKVTATTDVPFGVVSYDTAKQEACVAGDIVNVAYDYSVVKMEAKDALNAGAKVMAVINGMQVTTATDGQAIVGQACIKCAAGALVPVMIKPEV